MALSSSYSPAADGVRQDDAASPALPTSAALSPLDAALQQWLHYGLRLASVAVCLLLWQWASAVTITMAAVAMESEERKDLYWQNIVKQSSKL